MNIPKMKDVSDNGSPAGTGGESVNYASSPIGGEMKAGIKAPPANSIDIAFVKKNGKRKRGRPRNDDPNRPASIVKWVPKEWTPVYEQIVSLDCMGVPQKKIAEQFNMTNVMVSKICCTPQAKIIRRAVLESLAEKNKVFQEERFSNNHIYAYVKMDHGDLLVAVALLLSLLEHFSTHFNFLLIFI